MKLTITNGASTSVDVAVSAWRNDGNDSYYSIAQAESSTWDRSDARGYLMSVKMKSKVKVYYVSQSSKIVIGDSVVKDQGQTLTPLDSVNNT
ncbi:MAG: hypothetical protein ACN6QY_27775 [Pseudomonas sp.]|uniref:hypothetical protein n=1 Tax=Pseudomonas sp. TaxID=306 RepID=UPI003D1182C2